VRTVLFWAVRLSLSPAFFPSSSKSPNGGLALGYLLLIAKVAAAGALASVCHFADWRVMQRSSILVHE